MIKIIYDDRRHKKQYNRNNKPLNILAIALLLNIGLIIFGKYTSEAIVTSKSPSYSSEINSEEDSTVSVVSEQSSLIIDSSVGDSIFHQSSDQNLVLVNSKVGLPQQFEAQIVDFESVRVDKRIIPYYESMKNAALKDGIYLWLSSGYRSDEEQKKLSEEEVNSFLAKGYKSDEAVIEAAKSVAPPGCSEHITGLALDLNGVKPNFYKTDTYQWLIEHSSEYGFILRYPEGKEEITGIIFEPWHFRYVGVENAKAITENNMCLEEYLSSIANK